MWMWNVVYNVLYTNRLCCCFVIIRRLFEFRKYVSNRDTCYNLIPRDYPVQITRVNRASSYWSKIYPRFEYAEEHFRIWHKILPIFRIVLNSLARFIIFRYSWQFNEISSWFLNLFKILSVHWILGRKDFRLFNRRWGVFHADGIIFTGCGTQGIFKSTFSTSFTIEMEGWKLQTNMCTFRWHRRSRMFSK